MTTKNKIIGVGGGGINAVNHIYRKGIRDVDLVICDTDVQTLSDSPVIANIQLGPSITEGRGTGANPDTGLQAAIESINNINILFSDNTKIIVIVATMGGGTGTGAAPVIAKAAKESGILTIAIVTIPFRFERMHRINQAIEGILEIEKYVDSLFVLDNDKLCESYSDLRLSETFSLSDELLYTAAKDIAELFSVPGYINVNFSDLNEFMRRSGFAIIGFATSKGVDRFHKAIEAAIQSPSMNNIDLKEAKSIILYINVSSSEDLSLDEMKIITDYINDKFDPEVHCLWNIRFDESLESSIRITIIATRFTKDAATILA